MSQSVNNFSGFYDQSQVEEMIRESIKMSDFDHPNVLTLIGVCVDGGPAPYIVTPFMSNGSLFCYLKRNRAELILGEDADEDQVAKYEYLDWCSRETNLIQTFRSQSFLIFL